MRRREFLGGMGAATAAVAMGGRAGAKTGRPNIVLIMADDMGFSDLGCYGSEISTPNLNRLAAGGIRFRNFYNAARCCPTRASLLTGLYPHQAGVGHMNENRGTPAYQGYLNRSCVTIAEAMKGSGYHTYMAGKWHVGLREGHWPNDRGFDEFFGMLSGATNYFKPAPMARLCRNRERVEAGPGFYTTDAFTDHAIQFIRDGRKKDHDPFFLYLAFNAPHWPLHARPDDIARYEDRYLGGWEELREERYERQLELGMIDPRWKLTRRDRGAPPWKMLSPARKRMMAHKMAVYAAMVDRVDQNVGRLLETLRDLGIDDNTLVMFLSDNGACHESGPFGWESIPGYAPFWKTAGKEIGSAESFASYGRSWSNASNTPFRLHKHWTNEGGISTPLIANWPGVIRTKGQITDQVGHIIDIMATCVDAAGAKYPETHNGEAITPLEGKSLTPVFKTGAREGHQAIFWEHEGNRAVRSGKWKLVSDYPGPWQLYDMESDRTEIHNLARRDRGRVKSMAEAHRAWADRVGVMPWNPLPVF